LTYFLNIYVFYIDIYIAYTYVFFQTEQCQGQDRNLLLLLYVGDHISYDISAIFKHKIHILREIELYKEN